MEVIYVIVAIVVVYWLYKGYKWIEYKNKYPILSETPPDGILSEGDYVTFGKYRKQFYGIYTKHGDILYKFMPDNSITPDYHNKAYIYMYMDAVYGIYGIKWKKVK